MRDVKRVRFWKRFVVAGMMLVLTLSAAHLPAADEAKKDPVPNEAAQKESSKLVADVYKKDYAAAATPAEKVALAKKMLKDGLETTGDPSGRHALLRIAADIAAGVGNAETAFAAIDEIEKTFVVDGLKLKSEALAKITSASRPGDDLVKSLGLVDGLIEQTLAADRADVALALATQAAALARKGSTEQIKLADARKADLEAAAKQFEGVKAALETLARQADDPAANLAVGRYRCFVQGNWERGVPLLALGSDPALRDLAAAELTGVKTAAEQIKLADSWWDYAAKETGLVKQQTQRHAAAFYRLAQPQVTGITRAKVEQRLSQLVSVPAGPRRDFPVGEVRRLAGFTGGIFIAVFSPDGRTIAGGGEDSKVYLWNNDTGELLSTLKGHAGGVRALSFSPTGDKLLSGGDDRLVHVWDVASGRELLRCEGHTKGIERLRFVEPAAKKIVSAAHDRTVRTWDATSGKELARFSYDKGIDAYAKDISTSGGVLITGGIEGTGHFWDTATGKALSFPSGHMYAGALSPSGRIAVTANGENSVRVWDVPSKKVLANYDNPSHARSLRFSHDGRRILVGLANHTGYLIDVQTRKMLMELGGVNGEVHSVEISRDGRFALTTGGSSCILWRLPD